jgi:alkylresorcinol/alkylpyrone synthase
LQRPAVLDRLHGHCGVEQRHLVMPLEGYHGVTTWGQANDLWVDFAQALGRDAICRAITPLGLMPADIDALYFVTVTGVASPSVDARLVNRMGLSPHLKRVPIFGLGCVAGAAGLARAADYVRAFPDQIAVVLSVELCSLTWQRGDTGMANMISTGLFGDGAAAAVVAGRDTEFRGPEVLATRSVFYPGTEEVMGWDISETGFHIVLSPDVPKVIRENLGRDVDSLLSGFGLGRGDISSWIIHTGGPKVLKAVEESLDLPPDALDLSWRCLKRVGNLSSASVLVVLEEVLARRRGEPGTYSILGAMGPGFCSELLLLRW